MTLLSITGLTAAYGPIQAQFGVDLDVQDGECTAIPGRNGTDRSTTIKAICRMLPHHGGRIALGGQALDGLSLHKTARLGIGLMSEGRRCCRNLIVTQNLHVAARPGPWDFGTVTRYLPSWPNFAINPPRPSRKGEHQILAIGRAWRANPSLLILDEVTEMLAPFVRHEIWTAVRALKDLGGLSILVVDKFSREQASVADHAVVLARGASVWSGARAALPNDPKARHPGI